MSHSTGSCWFSDMAAAADTKGELQKELVCAICLDYFDDPVILKCGHNFCRMCILMHWEENGGDDIGYQCPECRMVFGKMSFTKNYLVKNLVDKLSEFECLKTCRPPAPTKPAKTDGKCERHHEELKLYCHTDRKPICVVCRESRDHRRHLSIRARTTVAQQLPADYKEKLAIFRTYCSNKITDKKIQPNHITNMDEVPLSFDIPVNHTVEKKGTSTISIRTTGHEKPAFTVVLGCYGNGQKLLPMVIFKRKTLPKEKFPAGVIVKANQKGWVDEEKMREWLREVYVKRPDGFFHASPSLLICDSMRAHLTATVKNRVKQMNSELAIIPGGLTKELQPLDIGVNGAFKVKLRAAWERWMTDGEHTFTKTHGRQRRASYATICEWIVDAWAKISALTVVRAFAKVGIIAEQPPGNETDSDNDEREPGMLHDVAPVPEVVEDMKGGLKLRLIKLNWQKSMCSRVKATDEQAKADVKLKKQALKEKIEDDVGALVQFLLDEKDRLLERLEAEEAATIALIDENLKLVESEAAKVDKAIAEIQNQLSEVANFESISKAYSSPSHVNLTVQAVNCPPDFTEFTGPFQLILWKKMMHVLHTIKYTPVQHLPQNLTLDLDTAHPSLAISDFDTKVEEGRARSHEPDLPCRFTRFFGVLATAQYSSGQHYWEVDVRDKGVWYLGVTTARSNRKGFVSLSPSAGYWSLSLHDRLYANEEDARVPVADYWSSPRVGVFLDYERGHVAFYDAVTMKRVYSFAAYFDEPVSPFFSPGKNDPGSRLQICHYY
ncbi:hypothetical protein QTP86_016788 [Hemibagrus guttatus]|nr:hypothetical protein QTP86_016788 [Hemibagrus guttatus]